MYMEEFVPEKDATICNRAINKAKFMVSVGVRKSSDEFMVFLSGDDEFLVCPKRGTVKRRIRKFVEEK